MECVCPVDEFEIRDGVVTLMKTKPLKMLSNVVLFDSDHLLHDPRPNFKKLSIEEFDRYSRMMFYGIMSFTSKAYGEIVEVDSNRLERHFRIKMVVRNGFEKTFGDRITKNVFEDSNNLEHVEYFATSLNKEFGLIPMTIDRYFEEKNLTYVGNRILLDFSEKDKSYIYPHNVRKDYAEWMWKHNKISMKLWQHYHSNKELC